MKDFIGVLFVLLGIIGGLYIGIGICLIGGVITLIEQIRAEYISTITIAWALIKIFFSGFFGTLAGIVITMPGLVILNKD